MKKTVVKILGTVALTLLGANLQALDLANKGYADFGVGPAFTMDAEIKGTGSDLSFEVGERFDVAVGYHINEEFAVEIQSGYIHNDIDSFGGGDFYEVPIMANVIYNVPVTLPWELMPYVGAGAGAVVSTFDGSGIDETDTAFGFQGIVGIKRSLSDHFAIGGAYKILGTTDHEWSGFKTEETWTHALVFTMTYRW